MGRSRDVGQYLLGENISIGGQDLAGEGRGGGGEVINNKMLCCHTDWVAGRAIFLMTPASHPKWQ